MVAPASTILPGAGARREPRRGNGYFCCSCSLSDGHGKLLTLTGKLGEVMQESAQAAMSYLRSRAGTFGQLAVIGVKHMDEVLRHALAHPQPDEFLCEPSSVVDWRIVETMPPSDPRVAH